MAHWFRAYCSGLNNYQYSGPRVTVSDTSHNNEMGQYREAHISLLVPLCGSRSGLWVFESEARPGWRRPGLVHRGPGRRIGIFGGLQQEQQEQGSLAGIYEGLAVFLVGTFARFQHHKSLFQVLQLGSTTMQGVLGGPGYLQPGHDSTYRPVITCLTLLVGPFRGL